MNAVHCRYSVSPSLSLFLSLHISFSLSFPVCFWEWMVARVCCDCWGWVSMRKVTDQVSGRRERKDTFSHTLFLRTCQWLPGLTENMDHPLHQNPHPSLCIPHSPDTANTQAASQQQQQPQKKKQKTKVLVKIGGQESRKCLSGLMSLMTARLPLPFSCIVVLSKKQEQGE